MEKRLLDGDRIFVVRGLLSAKECDGLVERAERQGFEPAAVRTETGDVVDRLVRDNARLVFADPTFAELVWGRIAPLVPGGQGGWWPVALHEQFRVYRYGPGQHFARHFDGYLEVPGGLCSHLTLLVYLNHDFEGGATRFYPFHLDEPVTVRPERGQALVFLHRQLHEGLPVEAGQKYVLRTDVLFRQGAE